MQAEQQAAVAALERHSGGRNVPPAPPPTAAAQHALMLQVEQAARVAAQRMLEELQQQYNAAVDEAVAERLHRERLAEQLSELQSQHARLADFVWQLDLSQLDQGGLQAASDAVGQSAAHSAPAAVAPAAPVAKGVASSERSTAGSALLLPLQHAVQHQPLHNAAQHQVPAGGVRCGGSIQPAGINVSQALVELSSVAVELASGGQAANSKAQDDTPHKAAAKKLLGRFAEVQACVEEQSEQAAAAAAAARQLSVLLRVERSQRRQLEERLTAATGHVRAARQGLLLEQQHVQELEELVKAAVAQAEGNRELLEKMAAGESSSSGGAGRLRLGEIWSRLMESEQRACTECAAMKGPSTAAAAASQGAEGYQQGGLVEAWRLLDAARQAASREQHDLGRQLRTSQPAGLLERMHALSRRYSSSQSSVQFEEDEGPAAAISSLESSSPKLGATTEAADPTHNTAPGQAVEPAVTDSDAAGNATDSAVRTLLPGTTAGWCYSQSKPRENAHRERLDVAERFASLLNSFQQQLSGLSAAATPTQVDAAETRPHEAAEGPQAGRAVPVETSSAAHPEGARTPVSSDAAVKSAAATAGRVRSTARRSFWADNSTQTDPPIVDEAVYLQAFPSTPARKGRIVGVLAGLLLVLQPLVKTAALLAALLLVPASLVIFNCWSAAAAAAGDLMLGLVMLPCVKLLACWWRPCSANGQGR